MRSTFSVGRLFGVEIGLHYSWIAIAAIVTLSLTGQFHAVHPGWTSDVVWASALLTGILFFVTLIAHELSHAIVANSRGVPVRSVTLFALGGVAQMESEPGDAKSEFWIAIAGPVASVAIAAGCLGAAWGLGWKPMSTPTTPPLSVLVWLGYINFTLAAFNLIPGYPLDGGRVLRAVVWWITGNAGRAMRVSAIGGRIVALLFIASGLLRFAAGATIGGLWIAFIGWFLLDAANASYTHHRITEVLRGVRAGDLMIRDCPTVDSRTNLETFIDTNLLHSGRFCFIVTHNGEPAGLVGPREIHDIPRPQWPYRTLGDVMRPLEDAPVIGPDVSIADALEKMGREKVNQLPVAEGGHIQGILSRATILGFLEARAHMRI